MLLGFVWHQLRPPESQGSNSHSAAASTLAPHQAATTTPSLALGPHAACLYRNYVHYSYTVGGHTYVTQGHPVHSRGHPVQRNRGHASAE